MFVAADAVVARNTALGRQNVYRVSTALNDDSAPMHRLQPFHIVNKFGD